MKFTCFNGLKLRRKSDSERNLLSNQQLASEKHGLLGRKAIKIRKSDEDIESLIPASEKFDKNSVNLEQFIDINARTSSWYLPEVSAEKSAEILEALPVGRFVIRKSNNKLYLHLKHTADVSVEPLTYAITAKDNGISFAVAAGKHFSNISSLVVHHSIMPEALPVTLRIAEIHDEELNSGDIDFIDIDVDPEFSDLVSRLKSNMTFV
jgi:hypothetical protein